MKKDLPICPERYEITDKGQVINKQTGRVLKHSINPSGYHIVVVSHNGQRKAFSVHRQVMLAFNFIANHKDFEVNHIDGDKDNNCIWNLEWVTQSENTKHAINILGHNRDPKYRQIVARSDNFEKVFDCVYEVVDYFDVHPQSVYRVLNGKRKTLKGCFLSYA